MSQKIREVFLDREIAELIKELIRQVIDENQDT